MTRLEFKDLLQAMAEAWNAGDARAAAECFSEEVSYSDPVRYAFRTREELVEFFGLPEGESQTTVWHTVIFDEEEQAGAAEYTYEGTHRYQGLVLVRVAGGKVTHWREYQHVSEAGWEAFVDRRS